MIVVSVNAADGVPRTIRLDPKSGQTWTWTGMENVVDANGAHPQVGRWEHIPNNTLPAGGAVATYELFNATSADRTPRVLLVSSHAGTSWTWTSMESILQNGINHPQLGKWEEVA